MNKKKVAVIFARLKSRNPQPTTELEYSTPFELLVAVILSAQATDKSVNLATRTLFKHANTAAGDCATRRRRPVGLHPYDRPVQLEGEERHRDVPHPARTTRRRRPADA
jgi:hypothetical protein